MRRPNCCSSALSRGALVLSILLSLLLSLLLSGCVERFLRVETRPAGATVFIDGQRVGESPVDWPFVHYGAVRVDVFRNGHRARSELVELETPWFQWIPLDLFSELVDPRTHVDQHDVVLELEPLQPTVRPEPERAGNRELLELAVKRRGES